MLKAFCYDLLSSDFDNYKYNFWNIYIYVLSKNYQFTLPSVNKKNKFQNKCWELRWITYRPVRELRSKLLSRVSLPVKVFLKQSQWKGVWRKPWHVITPYDYILPSWHIFLWHCQALTLECRVPYCRRIRKSATTILFF